VNVTVADLGSVDPFLAAVNVADPPLSPEAGLTLSQDADDDADHRPPAVATTTFVEASAQPVSQLDCDNTTEV
jgi:hypothetical protein